MVADLSYANEKYSLAVRSMALGHGSLRSRLAGAYAGSASSAHPPRGGLGPEIEEGLQRRIEEFHESMTRVEATAGEGRIAATVREMTDHEVDDAARELLAIADELQWAAADWRASL